MRARRQIDDGEIETLRARLEEAEETLRAIRSGAVDALVIQGPDGDQIFTLKGAEEPYRLLVERMQEGALTLTAEGNVVYSNRHFAEMLGLPLEQVIGKSVMALIAAEHRPTMKALMGKAAKGFGRRELLFTRGDGSVFPALLSLSALPIGEAAAMSAIVTDLTEQKRNEGIAAAERFARSILEQATDAVVVCDRAGRITHASHAAEGLSAMPLIGRPFTQAFPLEAERIRGSAVDAQAPIGAFVEMAVAGTLVHGAEVRSRDERWGDKHFLLSAAPLRDGHGEPVGCIVTLTEITERKRTEERQRVLLAELSHRVKNNLAIVRSVASQTLSSSRSLEAFEEAFDGRLKALSLAHSVLTQTGWGQADLGQLVEQTVAPYRGVGRKDGITFSGPAVSLPSQAVLPLAMIFHELATNATKYGALSAPAGRIRIAWSRKAIANRGSVRLTWTEQGGPPVTLPTHRGFGSALITRTASYDLEGEADLDYRREGLRCVLTFPLQPEQAPALDPLSEMPLPGPECDRARST